MNMKRLLVLGAFIVVLMATLVSAIDAQIVEVKMDGDKLDPSATNDVVSFDRGNDIEIKVRVKALSDINDAQIEANMRGYDHDDLVEDITEVFDMDANTTYIKTLTLKVPVRMDQDEYKLRVMVNDRNGNTLSQTYNLKVASSTHDLQIRDVVISPEEVVAGRAVLVTASIRNYGMKDEEDIKVTASVDDLGISASDYIDEVESDEEERSEEMFLRIPACAKAGKYDLTVEALYHDGDEISKQTYQLEVIGDDTCTAGEPSTPSATGKTTITVGPETQDVAKGAAGVIYPVTIANTGSAKTYTITVTGGDWGTFSVSPSNVITVGKDETRSAYIFVSANTNAQAGKQVFGVEVKSGNQVLETMQLNANVKGASNVDLKRALEIGFVVLVVILVILGLIIGFNKLKGEESKEEGESYY